jgi:hypothetical protein
LVTAAVRGSGARRFTVTFWRIVIVGEFEKKRF